MTLDERDEGRDLLVEKGCGASGMTASELDECDREHIPAVSVAASVCIGWVELGEEGGVDGTGEHTDRLPDVSEDDAGGGCHTSDDEGEALLAENCSESCTHRATERTFPRRDADDDEGGAVSSDHLPYASDEFICASGVSTCEAQIPAPVGVGANGTTAHTSPRNESEAIENGERWIVLMGDEREDAGCVLGSTSV